MSFDLEKTLERLLENYKKSQTLTPEDFPGIDLYMDQVTSFMDRHLSKTVRNVGEDKVLTKTMINNYAKNDLLPPPEKKKYSKEHMVILMFIFYFKNVLSIKDIQSILNPITDKYFGKDRINIEKIYKEIIANQDEEISAIEADIKRKYELTKNMFESCNEDDKELLQTFSFISMMTFDIYARKMVIQKIIDEFAPDENED